MAMCKGIEKYAEEYADEQVLSVLIALVQKGQLAIDAAAEEIGMSPEEFQKRVDENIKR